MTIIKSGQISPTVTPDTEKVLGLGQALGSGQKQAGVKRSAAEEVELLDDDLTGRLAARAKTTVQHPNS